ncbi:MAG TPA: hypothetical protein VMW87_14150 [Spirochaetia bacterium]|nr:hypothetical protein [Spirochaetia bacterium]
MVDVRGTRVKLVDVPGNPAPGESKTIEPYALFADTLRSITEGTKVDGQNFADRRIERLMLWSQQRSDLGR